LAEPGGAWTLFRDCSLGFSTANSSMEANLAARTESQHRAGVRPPVWTYQLAEPTRRAVLGQVVTASPFGGWEG
jgi:hypothetical protein